jgi:hypothetical protein
VDLELKEKIYFAENNLFLILKGTLKLIMLNRSLEFREKDFLEIVERFDAHWDHFDKKMAETTRIK